MQTVNITDISKKLTSLVKGSSLYQAIEEHEATKQQVKEATASKYGDFGDVIEEPKNGIKPLTVQADNAADTEEAAEQASITKIDPSIANKIDGMKNEIPAETLTNIDKLFKSTKVTLTDIFQKAKPALETNAAMLKETITDGSIESISGTLKQVANATVEVLNGFLNELKSQEFTGKIEQLTADSDNTLIGSKLLSASRKLEEAAVKTSAAYPSGNLLKDLAETITSNVSSEIKSIGIKNVNEKQLSSRLLNNDVVGVQNTLVSKLEFSPELEKALGQSKFSSLDEARSKLTSLNAVGNGGLNINPADQAKLTTETNDAIKKLDAVAEKVKPNLGTVGATVVSEDEDTPSNPNPIVDAATSKNSPFTIFNSTEELTKYFLSAEREITTLIINGGNSYKDQQLTAEEKAIDTQLKAAAAVAAGKFPNGLDATNGIAHFWIRKDGTIESMRSIENYWGGKLGGDDYEKHRKYSILLEVNAGIDMNKPTRGEQVPLTAFNINSWTGQIYSGVDAVVLAFYNAFPNGQVFGYGEVIFGANPKNAPFNANTPYIDSKFFRQGGLNGAFSPKENSQTAEEAFEKGFLSSQEIATLNSTASSNNKNEKRDTQ